MALPKRESPTLGTSVPGELSHGKRTLLLENFLGRLQEQD